MSLKENETSQFDLHSKQSILGLWFNYMALSHRKTKDIFIKLIDMLLHAFLFIIPHHIGSLVIYFIYSCLQHLGV